MRGRFYMRNQIRISASWATAAFFAGLFFSITASAETLTANPANGKNIFENGKGDVPACMSCHGANGEGMDAMQTPRLANLGYAYVVKQLTDFANDKRIDLTLGVMNTNAKGLTEQDRRDVAAYVNTLNVPIELSNLNDLKSSGTAIGEAYRGQILVLYGVRDKVSACQSCHGYNGRGRDPIYPKIGQQKFVYLVNQLHHWRDGSNETTLDPNQGRINDPMGQMRAIAKNLTDQDILDAATYLSQAPDTTAGNNFLPDNQTTLENVLKK